MNKYFMFASVAALAVSTTAFATPGNAGGGQGGCGQGQTTNGCGTPTPTPTPVPTPTPTNPGTVNNGGNGTGGNASAGAIAGAAAINNTNLAVDTSVFNENANANYNTNTAANFVSTGDVDVSSRNTNNVSTGDVTNNLRNGDVSTAVRTGDVQNNTNVATGNQSASSNQDQSQSTSNSNNSSFVVEGDAAQARNPVSTAYAAPLTAGFDTCMGSSTAGAQGIGFGISLGSTWTDKNCVRLKNARELASMGYSKASVQLLCQNKDIAEAMEAAGTPCVAIKEEVN